MAEETRSFTRAELTKFAEKAAMKGAGLMADEMAPRIAELEAQLAQAQALQEKTGNALWEAEAQLAAEKSRADRLASLVAVNVETWADRAIKSEAQLAQAQAERESLAAQMGASVEVWRSIPFEVESDRAILENAIANLPAAAEKLMAAQRYCEAKLRAVRRVRLAAASLWLI